MGKIILIIYSSMENVTLNINIFKWRYTFWQHCSPEIYIVLLMDIILISQNVDFRQSKNMVTGQIKNDRRDPLIYQK